MNHPGSIVIRDLFRADRSPVPEVAWQPFRPGIEIHRLYGDGTTGPSAALLRYAPGASLPLHTHIGYEHILVLRGSQVDAGGEYSAGTLLINPPGTSHAVNSPQGCIVYISWEKPVAFATG